MAFLVSNYTKAKLKIQEILAQLFYQTRKEEVQR